MQFFYFVNAGCLVPIENSLFVDKKQTETAAHGHVRDAAGAEAVFFSPHQVVVIIIFFF